MGHRAMVAGVALLSVIAMGGETAGGAPRSDGVEVVGSSTIEVRDIGPGGFTLELSVHPSDTVGADGCGCVSAVLPPVVGDIVTLGGRTEYAWLIGMPDVDLPTVELLDVRTELLGARSVCRTTSDGAARTDRLVRDVSLHGVTPSVLERLAEVASDSVDPPSLSDPVVEIAGAGLIRDQPIGRLVVRPVAVDDEGSLVVRTRIRARVRYADPAHVARASEPDGPFEALMDLLMNRSYVPRRVVERTRIGHAESAPEASATGAPVAVDPGRASDRDHGPHSGYLPALKIEVERDGPVVVTASQLAEAGWDLAQIDPRTLSLQCGGRAWAMQIDSSRDGLLGPGDQILFEGRAMTGPYTRANVYWLRPDGEALRVGSRTAVSGTEPVAQSFLAHQHFEEDTRILWSMTAGTGHDRWMWGDAISAPSSVTHTLRVGPVAAEPARSRLRLALHGTTDDRAVNPDHHVRIWWNGNAVHETRFDGLGAQLIDVVLPEGATTSGDNEMTIESVGDTGALVDAVHLNWLDLEYEAAFVATDDQLSFGAPGADAYRGVLRGFASRDVRVWDVTDASRPVTLSGVDVQPDGVAGYRVTFTDAARAGTQYVAFSSTGASPPARLTVDVASELRSPANGADYVVITHPSLANALAPLAARRSAQGLRVTSVLVTDIYDEFSHGVFDPRAIRSFLRYASEHWTPPAPTYVLLVGEANLDYRGGYGAGPPNLVPSMQMEHGGGSQMTLYTTDQWFAKLHDGDALPDLFIGRISASTSEQVAAVVDKTLRFEDTPKGRPWQRVAVLVADDNGAAVFEEASERLVAAIPADGYANRFYAGRYPLDRDLAADVRGAIDDGALALNFFGHGNVTLWSPWPGGARIFENHDIRALHNGDRMPVFTSGTCMNGWIDHPLKPVSMTEQWLIHPDGGGVVAWAASGFVQAGAAADLVEHVYGSMFDGSVMPMGALSALAGAQFLATEPAKAHAYAMYTLLGDPALTVSGAQEADAPVEAPTTGSAYLPRVVR